MIIDDKEKELLISQGKLFEVKRIGYYDREKYAVKVGME